MNETPTRTDPSLTGLTAGAVSGLGSGLLCGLAALTMIPNVAQPGALLALSSAWGALGGAFLGGLTGILGHARSWPLPAIITLAATAPPLTALILATLP